MARAAFRAGRVDVRPTGDGYAEAPVTGDFGLAEEIQAGVRLGKAEPRLPNVIRSDSPSTTRAAEAEGPCWRISGIGRPRHRPRVQGEFGQVLRDERDHARIVGAGRDFAENNVIAPDEQLDAEDAAATECGGDLFRRPPGFRPRLFAHGWGCQEYR